MPLIHGGQLNTIAEQYDIPREQWLDLSTGIAPIAYPIPSVPEHIWQQLPQENAALNKAAQHYYQTNHVLVTNGSQSIIKALPDLWRQHMQGDLSSHVFIPQYGYKEHQQAWADNHFAIYHYQNELPSLDCLTANCVLVVINPNNPTGQLVSKQKLKVYQQKITELKGLLVIDEAFMDVITPSQSLSASLDNEHTLILRSFGKFFGLAGIRIGFLLGSQNWLQQFSNTLGPWQVNGPAQFVAEQALLDNLWQQQQNDWLQEQSQKLQSLLVEVLPPHLVATIAGTNLFQTVTFKQTDTAQQLFNALCQQAVYVRLTDEKLALRFGMPTAEQLPRLKKALKVSMKRV
ncbi:threonine-phosphate decarboxylase [Saccharobesus litoralis]|uniref:threonine-phosphate decarboxylase n=1 Tax=Saccharobesus litoralis TaxID=2172099 RepID=A0A2S0VXD4_9ALTE|nr:threonine-phosphate decarboxylase CobD [Saccharobesus litoralis]AWB68871.1 threonine-phosphate decarboxylase [Saccharobesus litoralis]